MKVHCGGSFIDKLDALLKRLSGVGGLLVFFIPTDMAAAESIVKIDRQSLSPPGCLHLDRNLPVARTVRSTYLLLSSCYIKHISFLSNHTVILWKMISDKNVELLFVIIWSPSAPDKECNDGHAPVSLCWGCNSHCSGAGGRLFHGTHS